MTRRVDLNEDVYAKRHLLKYKKVLNARNFDSGELSKAKREGKWWVFSSARMDFNFNSEKIVSPQRSPTNTFGYNEIPWYASADVYYITSLKESIKLKYALALLNSKLYYSWLYRRGKRKGELLELYQKPLSEIPIREIGLEEQKPFINVVDKILEITSSEDYLDNLEKQIDQMVYELYDLSDEEIMIMEGASKDEIS